MDPRQRKVAKREPHPTRPRSLELLDLAKRLSRVRALVVAVLEDHRRPGGAAYVVDPVFEGLDWMNPLHVYTLAGMSSVTEITLLGGERHHIDGDPKEVERVILDAARGSLMQLAWLTEAENGQRLGVNPECVMTLRAVSAPG